MEEIKRLEFLKAEKEKSEKRLKWLNTKVGKLGIPPPRQLTTFELPPVGKKVGMKRKRNELFLEVFVKKNIIVDEMQRNLTLPEGVDGKAGMVIKEPEARIFLYNGNFDMIDSEYAQQVYDELIYEIESRPDFVQAKEIVQKNLDGMD
ncbi:hypothetical protein Tco_0889009 [Tanacetum coccineum]